MKVVPRANEIMQASNQHRRDEATVLRAVRSSSNFVLRIEWFALTFYPLPPRERNSAATRLFCSLRLCASEVKFFCDQRSALRDFRNYIHPHKEYTDNVGISEEDARMFWEVTKAITRQVLNSVGKSP